MFFFHRIANLFRRGKVTEEIEAELRSHLEMRTADNLADGMPPAEAHRDAALRFGNLLVIEERTAAVRLNQFIEILWRDINYASRQLRHSPAFALTASLTLGLAISANVVVFGVLNALLFAPLITTGSDRLFNVVQGPHGYENQSYPDYLDYRDGATSFTGLAAYRYNPVGLATRGKAYKCWDDEVSANFFDLLGIHPSLGRLFHASDEHGPDSAPYVVLSDTFWRSRFAADPQVVGTSVRLNGHPFTVIGIAPAAFHGTDLFLWPDFWVPMVNERQLEGYDFLTKRSNHGIWILGLLKPGISPRQGTENLNATAARLAKQYPSSDEGMKARLVKPGLIGDQIGDPARAFLAAMMGMALLLLLAACANLAGIFAARSADRQREMGIRLSIGAGRWRIVRQLLTEALLVACCGGCLGTLFAAVLLHALTRWQPFALPVHVDAQPGLRVYAVALLLSFFGGILPGLLPARQLWKTDLVAAIKNAASHSLSTRRVTLRDLLLAVQIALCALLLTSALVALRGLERSLHAPVGFDPQRVLLTEADMQMVNHTEEGFHALQKRMLNEAGQIPGVAAVGIINQAPLGAGGSTMPVYAAGTTDFRPSNTPFAASFFSISPGYLKAAGTRLLAGRDFTWHDDKRAPAIAIVNEYFAHRLFGSADPLGQRFKTRAKDAYRIVAVVETGKYESLTEDPQAAIFFPIAQSSDSETTLVVRCAAPTAQVAAALNNLLPKIDPDLPYTVHTWPEALSFVLFPARVATAALGIMGLLAAMLAITGVFGMAAYSVSKRKKEFGIRLALGSRASQLIRTALGRPVILLIFGSFGGLGLGLFAGRILGQIVYQATPGDPLVWVGVLSSMFLFGVLATWVPARRALKSNPMTLLKDDA